MNIKSQKNGKIPKDSCDEQRVVFLLEKYEQHRALENDWSQSGISNSDSEEEEKG